MNKRCLISCVLLSLLMSTACTVRHEVYRVTNPAASGAEVDGVLYSLPRTVVNLDFPITRVVRSESRFSKDLKTLRPGYDFETFAQDADNASVINYLGLLGIEVLSKTEGPIFSLQPPEIDTAPEPDPEQNFLVKIAGRRFADRSLVMSLDDLGVITSVDSTVTDRTTDFAVKTISTVADIVGTLAFGAPVTRRDDDKLAQLRERAESILDNIARLRERRLNLVSPTAAMALPPETLRMMLDELKGIERGLVAYFEGDERTSQWTLRVELRPTKGPETAPARKLFAFQRLCGVRLDPDPSIEVKLPVVPTDFSGADCTSWTLPEQIRADWRQVGQTAYGEVSGLEPATDSSGARGFYYRLPAKASIRVERGAAVVLEATRPIAQLGTVASLPPDTNSTKVQYIVRFHKDLGSIETVEVRTFAPTAQPIEDIGAVVSGLIEKRRADDELASLQRRAAVLKQRVDIRKLESELTELQGGGEASP